MDKRNFAELIREIEFSSHRIPSNEKSLELVGF